jgi:excisionase family DNA binding protein
MAVNEKTADILTVFEAADFLQLSSRSVYRLLKERKIPARKIMHKWRFEREQLREWVRNNSDEATSNG